MEMKHILITLMITAVSTSVSAAWDFTNKDSRSRHSNSNDYRQNENAASRWMNDLVGEMEMDVDLNAKAKWHGRGHGDGTSDGDWDNRYYNYYDSYYYDGYYSSPYQYPGNYGQQYGPGYQNQGYQSYPNYGWQGR